MIMITNEDITPEEITITLKAIHVKLATQVCTLLSKHVHIVHNFVIIPLWRHPLLVLQGSRCEWVANKNSRKVYGCKVQHICLSQIHLEVHL